MALDGIGLVKTTLIDYPGHVAATLFTPGCNMRCPYCHNPELITGAPPEDARSIEEVLAFLESRKKVLQGVCITGGEPLMHADLPELIDAIRRIGLKIKIDTNGTFPERLKSLSVDFIAMDIKSSLDKYEKLGFQGDADKVRESIAWIIHSGIEHQFRTTAAPGFFGPDQFDAVAELIEGCRSYVINPFRDGHTLDTNFSPTPYTGAELERFQTYMQNKGIPCRLNNSYRTV